MCKSIYEAFGELLASFCTLRKIFNACKTQSNNDKQKQKVWNKVLLKLINVKAVVCDEWYAHFLVV